MSLKKEIHAELVKEFDEGRGRSKRAFRSMDPDSGPVRGMIFSARTFHSYYNCLKPFADYVESVSPKGRMTSLAEARGYLAQYLEGEMRNAEKSAWTRGVEKCAAVKLFRLTKAESLELPEAPKRRRDDIRRSRGRVASDSHFSSERHRDLEAFFDATGLRRQEARSLTGECLAICTDLRSPFYGQACLHVVNGSKGGRERWAPIVGGEKGIAAVRRFFAGVGDGVLVFHRLCKMDIHSRRENYAAEIVRENTRKRIPKAEAYRCRGERRGEVYDKRAVGLASAALGHSEGRFDVVVTNYLLKRGGK
jgi:hypothetical protein